MKRSYQTFFENDNNHDVDDDDDSEIQSDYKITQVIGQICSNVENDSIYKRKCNCDPYRSFIRAGPFVLGCQLTDIPQLSGIDNYIARKIDDINPNRYYLLKIVVLPKDRMDENQSQRQAKMMIYNEYSVLSLLKNHSGIIQIRGLYSDIYFENDCDNKQCDVDVCEQCIKTVQLTTETDINDEINVSKHSNNIDHHHYLDCKYLNKIGKFYRRLILAFDCHVSHIFSLIVPIIPHLSNNRYNRFRCEYENLQEYVKRYKNVNEMKALQILFEVVKVIKSLHEKNIAHRDLRLENILYNHRNGKILIINFGLARFVINDTTCINDHRGSSAYISPDVLKRRPYAPKPSDCWALGVIFYSMLLGKFPFYAETFNELFKKINIGHYDLPTINLFTSETMKIMRSLIEIDSDKRININELYDRLKQILDTRLRENLFKEMQTLIKQKKCINDDLQVVPDVCPQSSIVDRPKSRLNIEHDHNYVQIKSYKSPEIDSSDNESINKFEQYFQSNLCMTTPPQMPIPFLKLRERFCYDSGDNYCGTKFAHHHGSPFLEEMARHYCYQQQQQQQKSGQSILNDFERMEIQFNSNPVHLEFSNQSTILNGNGSTYDVIKVDSDVRPLNDQEYTIINQQLLRLYAPFSSK